MARRVIGDGFPTTLWARRARSLEPFGDTGAVFASDRRALGAASDMLCLCVTGDADVDEILRGDDGALAGMAPGGIVVIHSTVHPDTCRHLQADYTHLHFVDAPVSGGGHMAAAKAPLVMVGGERDPIKRCQPVFNTYANAVAASTYSVASSLGLDVDALINVLEAGSARSYAAEVIANSGRSLSVMAELAGPLLAKDVGILAAAVGANSSELLQMATATIAAMHLDDSVMTNAQ